MRRLYPVFWSIFGMLTLLCVVTVVQAATWYVPDNYTTIQAALDAVSAGEIVIVRDGTWTGDGNRNLDFGGKDIELRSENGPAACTIDAEGTDLEHQRCFNFHSGETRDARVEGFTITGGYVVTLGPHGDYGGGISCDGSSPTIFNCIIEGNMARYGAGIMADASNLYVDECIIRNNETLTATGIGGGIYFLASTGAVANSELRGNTAAYGGAVVSSYGVPLVYGCLVIGNIATVRGGGISWGSASAAIRFTTISGNEAPTGGGLFVTGGGQEIYKCTITGNLATGNGYGGGIYFSETSGIELNYSIVWYNSNEVQTDGAQIAAEGSGSTVAGVLHSCVQDGEGGFYTQNATVYWGEYSMSDDPQFCAIDPDADEWWELQDDSPAWTHGWGSMGAWASGCTSTPTLLKEFAALAGFGGVQVSWIVTADLEPDAFRLTGHRGGQSWQVPHVAIAADSFEGWDRSLHVQAAGDITYILDYTGVTGDWVQLSARTVSVSTPELSTRIVGVKPNPFNPQVTVAFAMAQPERALLSIYDLSGRQVATLADRVFQAGTHALAWDGKNSFGQAVSAGTYLVRLETDTKVESRKIILVK